MSAKKTSLATFAGGCFWCLEADFAKLPGVIEAVSGYSGGDDPNPTYAKVCSGESGHLEAVQVRYDPERVSYAQLLDWFWRHIDPTDPGGQFVDRGRQYATAIFYHDEEQRRLAQESKDRLAASGRLGRPIVTQIRPLEVFHPAEDYHQGFCRTNPVRYRSYRQGSGRDRFLDQLWGRTETDPVKPGGDGA
ncbi:MAG: peptide-methionine (S)-S-oxide reductase MsrA [Desulfarculus sp.]|nr:peptide-methionine (S)-S-oxide reductase MsrA [Desulfarculus sp.]